MTARTLTQVSLPWRIVRLIMLQRYGIRGGIKPPLNVNRANSLSYRVRLQLWKLDDWLYRKTGLPEEWAYLMAP